MTYFYPGAVDEYDRVGPWELEQHMREIAGWFKAEPHDDHPVEEFPGCLHPIAAIGRCPGCGRTLISVVHHEASRFIGHCGRCKPFSSDGNVDHAEWLRRRRGLA